MKIDRTNEFNLGKFLENQNWSIDLKIKRQNERSLQITELDPADIKLESFHSGLSYESCANNDWQTRLEKSGRIPLDIAVLEALLENPDQIPECIKNAKVSKGSGSIMMTFDGTILAHENDRGLGDEREPDLDEYLPALCNTGGILTFDLIRCYLGRGCLNSNFSVVV